MIQVNVTLTETIKVLLDEKKYSTLRDILTTMKPLWTRINMPKHCASCLKPDGMTRKGRCLSPIPERHIPGKTITNKGEELR